VHLANIGQQLTAAAVWRRLRGKFVEWGLPARRADHARSDFANRLVANARSCARRSMRAALATLIHRGKIMRAWITTWLVAVLTVGCTTNNTESLAADPQGLAELRVDAGPLLAAGITRITVDGGGPAQELVLNPDTGTFDGTLFLTTGTYSLIARAFSDDTLVGESRPTPVSVQPGIVTRVVIRILDVTAQAPPIFGPIFDSLTFPTTTEAGASVTFALSVIAPAGDPVTYAWTSSCADATFSAPDAATTTWSKPTPGGCTIDVRASSSGSNVFQSFAIVVFPTGSGNGAAAVSGTLVGRPLIQLILGDLGCVVTPGNDGSCRNTITSPAISSYSANVFSWGASTPGTLELSDSCGGRFGTEQRSPDSVSGAWLPPATGGLCILTARAVSNDGVVGTVAAAALTRPGTAPTPQPVNPFVNLETGCPLLPSGNVCGSIQAGASRSVNGNISFGSGRPGTVTVTDDCFGPLPPASLNFFFGALFIFSPWTVPPTPGATCTTTVHATSLEGSSIDVSASYSITP
jgi:hypothetical protein